MTRNKEILEINPNKEKDKFPNQVRVSKKTKGQVTWSDYRC